MALFFTLKELKTLQIAYEDYGLTKGTSALDKINNVLNSIHFDRNEIDEIISTLETLPHQLKLRGDKDFNLDENEVQALKKAKMIQLIQQTPRASHLRANSENRTSLRQRK